MSGDLIERLEGATAGPDRALDARIWWDHGPGKSSWPHHANKDGLNACGLIWGRNPKRPLDWADVFYAGPAYTASIDAALTLVPEGLGFKLDRYWIASAVHPVWSAHITRGGLPDRPFMSWEAWDAATPALAICIAALKATQGAKP